MADRTTVDASTVVISFADAPGGAYKSLVCETDSSVDLSRNETSEETKCGVLKELGPQNNKFSGNIVVVTDEDTDEASHADLLHLYTTKAKKYWTWTNTAGDVFVGGYGWVTSYSPQAPASGTVKASITIIIDGDIDTVEPSA